MLRIESREGQEGRSGDRDRGDRDSGAKTRGTHVDVYRDQVQIE